jgi:hypothetical protein
MTGNFPKFLLPADCCGLASWLFKANLISRESSEHVSRYFPRQAGCNETPTDSNGTYDDGTR